jgi:hypothetical protein
MGFSATTRSGSAACKRPDKRAQSYAGYRAQLAQVGADQAYWFETVGARLLDNKWCIFPETNDTGEKRRPANPTGSDPIRPVAVHKMDRQLPTPDDIVYWSTSKGSFAQNAALQTGDASGEEGEGLFVVDSDIFDPAASEAILAIADQVFGRSTFVRVCNAPKWAIPFRRPLRKLQLPMRNYKLAERYNGRVQQIEVKEGTALTLYGYHGVTGQLFRWIRECNPLDNTPADLLFATEEKVMEFLRRVHAQFPIEKFESTGGGSFHVGVDYADTDISEVRTPNYISDKILPAPGTKLDSNRKQGFLLPRSVNWASLNAGIVAPLAADGTRSVSRDGCRLGEAAGEAHCALPPCRRIHRHARGRDRVCGVRADPRPRLDRSEVGFVLPGGGGGPRNHQAPADHFGATSPPDASAAVEAPEPGPKVRSRVQRQGCRPGQQRVRSYRRAGRPGAGGRAA